VPEFFGENVHGTARHSACSEEVAFLRQEYGARLTADMPVRFLDANFTGYGFEVAQPRQRTRNRATDQSQIEVAAVRRDYARQTRQSAAAADGYRWYAPKSRTHCSAARGLPAV
jgi:hypothetical protein